MFENSPTLSCGRNWSGLSTWMLSFAIASFTSPFLACCHFSSPFLSCHFSWFLTLKSTRTVRFLPGATPSTSSVSTKPLVIGWPSGPIVLPSPSTHAEMLSPRPVILSGPPSPTHIAQTIDDLPVPFGPTMQLSRWPGFSISTSLCVMKLWSLMRAIMPRVIARGGGAGRTGAARIRPLLLLLWAVGGHGRVQRRQYGSARERRAGVRRGRRSSL